MRVICAMTCCAVLLTGCASLQCDRVGGSRMLQYHLFFGRDNVTDADWADFAAKAVTPSLPDGLTVFDAEGQWMNPETQQIGKERTKVLVVAVPDTAVSASAIAQLKDEYRRRFRQVSVGTTVASVCAAF